MDPAALVDGPLPPDGLFYDMLHDPDVVAGLLAFLDGRQSHFDVELLAADQSRRLWVRVTPRLYTASPHYARNWRIEDGDCQRLDGDGSPVGPVGSCNGYFTTVESPGHTVGKLDINIP